MAAASNLKPGRPRRRKTPPGALDEEIERIRNFLRCLDTLMTNKEKDDVSLKDLTHAVSIACAGGKSIAWLRKFERGLADSVKDGDYEQLRVQIFEMLEFMEQLQAEQGSQPGPELKGLEPGEACTPTQPIDE